MNPVVAVSKCGAGGLSSESLIFYRSCLSELRIHLDPKSSCYKNALNVTFIESLWYTACRTGNSPQNNRLL